MLTPSDFATGVVETLSIPFQAGLFFVDPPLLVVGVQIFMRFFAQGPVQELVVELLDGWIMV